MRPTVDYLALRRLCENRYPPEISENLDIIFRTVLDPIAGVSQSKGIAHLRHLLGSRYLLEYSLVRSIARRLMSRNAKVGGTRAPILVLLHPHRPDHYALLFAVTNLLAEEGVRIAVLVSRWFFRPDTDAELFRGASFIFEEDFYSLGAYRRAGREYRQLAPSLEQLSSELTLSGQQRCSLKILYLDYCMQREVFGNVLRAVAPSVVYGLHFIANPGFLGAIDRTGREGPRALKLLIQHGNFRSGGFHDFKGADLVLLWGEYFHDVLNQDFVIPTPPCRVMGNPKLEVELARREATLRSVTLRGEKREKTIVFVSTPDRPGNEYHLKAVRLFAKLLQQTCPSNWHVAYKPHPGENMRKYDCLIQEGIISTNQVAQKTSAIYDLMRGADVIVGGNSTALLEAAALGIPVVQMFPAESGTDWGQRGMLGISTEQELYESLQGILTDPVYCRDVLARQQGLVESMFGKLEGSSQRIADYVMSVMGSDSTTGSVKDG